jgi:uncharacterized protein YggE
MSAAIVVVAMTAAPAARAQQPPAQADAGVIVTGEGSVSVAPDYAEIRSGVTTRAKTAKEATDTNAKLMTAISAALVSAGIAQKDIQTSQFSLQPVYEPQQANAPPKLAGFSVSNQVEVTIREVDKVGDILDRLVTTGATNIGSIEFLHSDPSKVLDQAREAAMADARRKAEVYARAAGVSLGPVVWITEDGGFVPPMGMKALRSPAAMAPVPIASGEDTLQARVTVGFELARRP